MSDRGGIEVGQFAVLMLRELEANEHKGHWKDQAEGWDAYAMFQSLCYHVGKLGVAVVRGDSDAIREYAADVGNEAMMVADLAGVLEPPSPAPPGAEPPPDSYIDPVGLAVGSELQEVASALATRCAALASEVASA